MTTGAIDVKMDGSILEEKLSFKVLHLTLDWIGVLTLSSLLKLPPRKLERRFYEVFHSEVAMYLYKSTIRPCMEYCCHVWTGAPSCYLELQSKLRKWIYRTNGPSLAESLEPLAYCWNVASLSLFYRYHFGRCLSELAELVPLPHSLGLSTCYSDVLYDFSVIILRC